MPTLIKLTFAIEAALILLFAAVPWPAGGNLEHLFHLNHERNFPSYFSSIQLLVAALAFGIYAWRKAHKSEFRSLLLWLLPLLFLGLSMDEFIGIHEMMGRTSDWLLPGGTRAGSAFWNTGIWMILLGVPVVTGSLVVIWILRGYLTKAPGVMGKLILGFLVFMGGALGVESLSNFLAADSALHLWQIIVEEGMEMVGMTFVLWAALDNLRFHGFHISWAATSITTEEGLTARAPSNTPSEASSGERVPFDPRDGHFQIRMPGSAHEGHGVPSSS